MTQTIDKDSRRRYWYTATLGNMASYIDGATLVSSALALVLLQGEMHFSDLALGALSATLTLGFAAGAIIGGRLGDLFGRRRVYSIDLLVYAAGVLAVIVAPDLPVLFIGLAVTGLAMGADVPTSLALVAEEAPAGKQGGAIAYSQTLWLCGTAVTQILELIVGNMAGIGGRILFAHLLIVAIVVWIMRRRVAESVAWKENRHAAGARERRRLRAVFKTPYGWALLGTALFYIIGGVTSNTVGGQFGPFIFVNLAHSTTRLYAVVGLLTQIVSMVLAVLFQRYADGRTRSWFFWAGMVSLILTPLLAAVTGFAFWAVITMFFLNAIGGTLAGEAMYKIWTQEIFPTAIRGTAQGLTYGATRFAFSGIAIVTPTLIMHSPSTMMFLLVGMGIVAAGIAAIWIPRLPHDGFKTAEPTDTGSIRAGARRELTDAPAAASGSGAEA